MSHLVVDASVLAAVVYDEPRAEEAKALIRDGDLVAPPLIRYEVGNIARSKALRHRARAETLAAAFSAFLRLPLRLLASDPEVILHTAMTHDITYYDAAYLALAVDLGAQLATFDAGLASAHEAALA